MMDHRKKSFGDAKQKVKNVVDRISVTEMREILQKNQRCAREDFFVRHQIYVAIGIEWIAKGRLIGWLREAQCSVDSGRVAVNKMDILHRRFPLPNMKHKKLFYLMFFFGYRGSAANLGYACKHLGGLGPQVWEEIDPAQTVVNPKLEFIYRVDHKFVPLGANKKHFLWSHDFQEFNFKLTARALPVIPPKFTGVPVTQSGKIILM
jgi:hypothetical protein